MKRRNGRALRASLIAILIVAMGTALYSLWSFHGSTGYSNAKTVGSGSFTPGGGFMGGQRGSGGIRGETGGVRGGAGRGFGGGIGRGFGGAGRSVGGAGAGGSEETSLILYAAGFAVLFGAGAVLLRKQGSLQIPRSGRLLLAGTVLGTGFLLRVAVGPWTAGHYDLTLFRNWALAAAQGLQNIYTQANADYPPLYLYLLYLIGKAMSAFSLSGYSALLLKLPSIAADVLTAMLLYRFAAKRFTDGTSLLVAAFYVLNPAVFLNSTVWGQVDSFFTLLIVLALTAVADKKPVWAAAAFAVAVMMKPQGIIFLPVLFFELVRRRSLKTGLAAAAAGLGTAALIALPFAVHRDPLWIVDLFRGTVGEYPYASVNAYNFFSLIGANYTNSSEVGFLLSYHTWGLAFIAVTTLFSWAVYLRGRSPAFAMLAGLIQIAGVFTFSTSMHERYLFPAVALALAAYIQLRDKRLLAFAAAFTGTVYVNTHEILFSRSAGMNGATASFSSLAVALLNVILCFLLAKVAWELSGRARSQPSAGAGHEQAPLALSDADSPLSAAHPPASLPE